MIVTVLCSLTGHPVEGRESGVDRKVTTRAYIKIHSLLNSYKRIVAIIFLDNFKKIIVKSYVVNIKHLKKIQFCAFGVKGDTQKTK